MPSRMWKYASVARTKTKTQVSMGEKTVCEDRGLSKARILKETSVDGLNRRVCDDLGINCYMRVRKATPRLKEWYETGRMVALDGGDA